MSIKIAPSLLASDFAALGEESRRMEAAGADLLHLDVLDGHFVPNLTIGPDVVAALRRHVSIPLDVHLMVSDPLYYAKIFARAGADILSFHLEAESPVEETLALIRSLGCRPGLAVKPETPPEAVYPYLSFCSLVMVMTVELGFGGQHFMDRMLPKISAIRRRALEEGLDIDLEVDGGIDCHTAPLVVQAGANLLVSGSALFETGNYARAVAALRNAAERPPK